MQANAAHVCARGDYVAVRVGAEEVWSACGVFRFCGYWTQACCRGRGRGGSPVDSVFGDGAGEALVAAVEDSHAFVAFGRCEIG